mmetsp:Transcript_17292/g.49484  ORF Transcript_17292/g.49484 Transcript_17292/m.49484 type:complete len:283 (+) Transcript_17292:103-951(+)
MGATAHRTPMSRAYVENKSSNAAASEVPSAFACCAGPRDRVANMSSLPDWLPAMMTCLGCIRARLPFAGAAATKVVESGMSPNQTTSAVLSSLPSRRWASSTSCCAASFAGSSPPSRSAEDTIRTASWSETGFQIPSLAKTRKQSSRRSMCRMVTSGTALTTPAGCLYSRSPKPRDTERPARPEPRILGSTMRQIPCALTTAEPSLSMRRRSPATSGVWSSERRTAEPSRRPRTTRLSPALATASRSRPSSSGPKNAALQAVDPAVAQACAAPPSSLFKYWK